MMRAHLLLISLLSLSQLIGASPAAAQDAATPSTAAAEEDPRVRAAAHFDRGITFFNEERYDAALAELARAYELAPAHQTLYNLARVHAALGHAVEATRAYERYLQEAGEEIDARRRREAQAALDEQRARVGHLMVRVDVSGATIAVDGVDVATTPLNVPIPLSAGTHTVEVHAPGREAVRRAVSIAGQTEERLEVSLREEVIPRGNLRVVSAIPEVQITVDGEPVGVTPLTSTLPLRAGTHTVTAERAGYRSEERQVSIEEGAEVELRFDMRRSPNPAPDEIGRVRLELPDAPYLVQVDGEQMLGEALDLPVGAHEITLEVTDRQPYRGTLRVPPGSTVVIVPPLAWTLDARQRRLDEAASLRTQGLVLATAGGVTLAGGLAFLIWNEAEISGTDARVRAINAELQGRCVTEGFDSRCREIEAEGQALADDQQTQNVIRGVTIATTVVGGLVGGLGLVLWLTAPSEDDVDAAARARARVTIRPGQIALEGAF